MRLKLSENSNVSGAANHSIAYFGGEPLSVPVLNALEATGIVPSLIVTNPDRPVGRKQVLTPPPAKVWALERGIEVFQPTSYKNTNKSELVRLTERNWDLFIVAAYNFILPKWLIEVPTHGTLNLHPSLLPKLRGPSPIRSAILNDEPAYVGVSIMLMDEEMDHGAILAQEPYRDAGAEAWPVGGLTLDAALAAQGGALLARTIPAWLTGTLVPTEQDHALATYTTKFTRADGELHLDPYALPTDTAAYQAYLKIKAFEGWPETYFTHKGVRIKIKQAELSRADDGTWGELRLLRLVPEGKAEMQFTDLFS